MQSMPSVDLDQLQGAVDWVSSDSLMNEAYVCRKTGRIYWIPDEAERIDEREQAPSDVQDPDKFLLVPDKYYLDLGNKLAFDFTAQYCPDCYDDVQDLFRRKGAYGRFKGLLAQKNLLDQWYGFSEQQTRLALQEWCKSEGLEVMADTSQ
jgi:hypothetical protein